MSGRTCPETGRGLLLDRRAGMARLWDFQFGVQAQDESAEARLSWCRLGGAFTWSSRSWCGRTPVEEGDAGGIAAEGEVEVADESDGLLGCGVGGDARGG